MSTLKLSLKATNIIYRTPSMSKRSIMILLFGVTQSLATLSLILIIYYISVYSYT